MALATVDQYGAPTYGPLGYRADLTRTGVIEGIVFHTPENATIFLANAIALARWQADRAANTSGGSYHGIIACRDGADPQLESSWVMVRSVPWDLAAGGLSSSRDPAIWQPGRHPWIKANMAPTAYGDPNAFLHQISLSGRTAWYAANGFPKGLLTTLAKWVKTLEGAYRYDALLMEHTMFQTNRSDVTGRLADAVMAEYTRLYLQPQPVDEAEALRRQVASLQSQVTTLTGRITKKNAAFTAAAADIAAGKAA